MSDMLSLLLQAVEKRLLRPLDIQFARLVAPVNFLRVLDEGCHVGIHAKYMPQYMTRKQLNKVLNL